MPTIARHVRVTGRVQGVFFRQWTCERARELGVAGWVRNCPDGSVEAHVEGEDAPVTRLIERLHRGPPASHVAEVRVEECPPEGCSDFEVRR